MKGGEEMGLEGRRAVVAPAVDISYDMDFMASKVLGRHWRELPDEQRSSWIETFRQLTINTYARRFESYSGQTFEVGGVDVASHGTAVVQTHIVSPGREPVEIRYRMRPVEDAGWQIVDI